MTAAMTNEAEHLNAGTVPGRWHAGLQAGTTPWAPRPLTQAHHAGPFQLPVVCLYEMHKSQMSDIGEAAFEKSVDTLNCAWRCLENGIILAAKVF